MFGVFLPNESSQRGPRLHPLSLPQSWLCSQLDVPAMFLSKCAHLWTLLPRQLTVKRSRAQRATVCPLPPAHQVLQPCLVRLAAHVGGGGPTLPQRRAEEGGGQCVAPSSSLSARSELQGPLTALERGEHRLRRVALGSWAGGPPLAALAAELPAWLSEGRGSNSPPSLLVGTHMALLFPKEDTDFLGAAWREKSEAGPYSVAAVARPCARCRGHVALASGTAGP